MYKLKEELDLSKIENDEYGKQINNDDQNETTLEFIEQIEHYSLKIENFLSKDNNIDGEILTKLKSLYLINHLKIKIYYPKYTFVS